MKDKCYKAFYLFIFLFFKLDGFKITRAIISWDKNPEFEFFWPIVSKAWNELKIRPTLIFIGSKKIKLTDLYGDIVYIEPILGIPTAFQAMCIRPLAAALFPDDICILSDLDMFPIKKNYFQEVAEIYSDDCFLVFYPNFYKSDPQRYMMCYNVAKGSTFKEIFKVHNLKDIRNLLISWYVKYFNIFKNKTDEKILYKYLNEWKKKDKNLKLLNLKFKRINREVWKYQPKALMDGHYVDAHLLRPYVKYKSQIDRFLDLLGFKLK